MSNTQPRTLYQAYYPNTYHVPHNLICQAFEAYQNGIGSDAWTLLERELGKPVKSIQPDYGAPFFYQDMHRAPISLLERPQRLI